LEDENDFCVVVPVGAATQELRLSGVEVTAAIMLMLAVFGFDPVVHRLFHLRLCGIAWHFPSRDPMHSLTPVDLNAKGEGGGDLFEVDHLFLFIFFAAFEATVIAEAAVTEVIGCALSVRFERVVIFSHVVFPFQ
jgi:hypothetical protein